MPRYSLRIGSTRVPIANTDAPLSQALGKRLASRTPQTKVDSSSGGTAYNFSGQEITFEDLRDIKAMREDGGQVAQLMESKALLNFGEGAEFQVPTGADEDALPTRRVDGVEMTLKEWLDDTFPHRDLLVLDLGTDALWYPFAAGETLETRGGDLKKVLPAEPHTLLPETDSGGDIIAWHQQVRQRGKTVEQTLDPADLWHIVLNRSSARDQTGISEVLRSREEIQAFKENEQAIRNAIELHGFPQRHVKAGTEDGAPVRDDDLRRIRNIFDPRTSDANTMYLTGRDVDVETLEAEQFDYTAIHEMDMRNLTTALGLPLEAGNVGADGLGSGKPAELRFALLKLNIKANQRAFGHQFVDRVLRPIVREYSPFDADREIRLEIDDPLEDIGEVADLIGKVGDYMTNAEARRKLDLAEPEDADIAEAYRSPADIERAEEGDAGGQGGLDQIFGSDGTDDSRTLADIPEKYTDGTGLSEDDFVPNESILDVIEPTMEFIDEHGLPNPDDQQEGAARINQIHDHIVNNDPLAVEFWQEIRAFHDRHRAQGNDECDESDLPEKATEIDNSRFDKCHFDNGWFSNRTWGGDPAYEQAQRVVGAIEDTEGVELSAVSVPRHFRAPRGDTDFRHRCLGGVTDADLQNAPDFDRPLLEMYQGVTDPDAPTDRTLVSFAESSTPEFVLERIQEAIRDGAMFAEFEDIPSDRLFDLREQMAESLTVDDGFTMDSIADSLLEFSDALDRDDAERIARTESSAILNRAREIGYEEQGAGDRTFYWTGAEPGDERQTEACEWLIRETNPFHGGDPVPMNELRDLIEEAPEHDDDMRDNLARPDSWIVHPNERSTLALAPEAGI